MGGNNQRKSSKSSFRSVFNIFKSSSNKQRGGGYYYDNGAYDNKVWPSDEDRGSWGVADPVIDMRATAFIAQYKKRISESEIHWQAQPEQ
jgi:hypothetical protein